MNYFKPDKTALSNRAASHGLYAPGYEHDACGVGMICSLKGEKSHAIVENGLQILVNLTHRGACGCDESTGDGAGILMQIPHRFLRKVGAEAGIRVPDEREYGCGLVFLPPDRNQRHQCMTMFENAVRGEKQEFLGWRALPVEDRYLGDLAQQLKPVIYQIFIGRGAGVEDADEFERKLFVIRKVIEGLVRKSELTEKSYFHIPSLSCRTLVYKGMLLALGFTGPEPDNIISRLDLALDNRGNIMTDENYMSSTPAIFVAGDARHGQSLVVWAISEGREAGRCVDQFLSGRSDLPSKGSGDLPRVP